MALLSFIFISELEIWVEIWAFLETIYFRFYIYIIRNIVNDSFVVFDDIVINE